MSNTNDNKISKSEYETCKKIFDMMDENGDGHIDIRELREFLIKMGYAPTDKDLFHLISDVDIEGKSHITFDDFLRLQIKEKNRIVNEVDQDVLNAFVALGGNADLTGNIEIDKIENILTEIFDSSLHLDMLFKNMGKQKLATLNFYEFKALLNK